MQMTCCFGHFRWLYSLSMWLMWMICCCHISHKNINTCPTQRLEQCAVLWMSCTTSQSLLLCSAVQSRWFLCKTQQTQHCSVFDWERFSGSLTQPHPTSEYLQISFTLWERTTCVYFNVLIRQWSSLHPACPLLRDTSKASVFMVGALQHDWAMVLLPGHDNKSRCSLQSIIFLKTLSFAFSKLSRFLSSVICHYGHTWRQKVEHFP